MTRPARDPRFSEARRLEALRLYRETRSYEKTGERMGISKKRAYELAREGLRIEMSQAEDDDAERTTNA